MTFPMPAPPPVVLAIQHWFRNQFHQIIFQVAAVQQGNIGGLTGH
jgi:hypothetical protein